MAVLELFTMGGTDVNTLYVKGHRHRSYDLPARGEWFLRIFKADGKPSKTFEKSIAGKFGGWYPEGVDPNVNPKAVATVTINWRD